MPFDRSSVLGRTWGISSQNENTAQRLVSRHHQFKSLRRWFADGATVGSVGVIRRPPVADASLRQL